MNFKVLGAALLCACSTPPSRPTLQSKMPTCARGTLSTYTCIDGINAFSGPALEWSASGALIHQNGATRTVSQRELKSMFDALAEVEDPFSRPTNCSAESDFPRLLLVVGCDGDTWAIGWSNAPTNFNDGLVAFDAKLQRLAAP